MIWSALPSVEMALMWWFGVVNWCVSVVVRGSVFGWCSRATRDEMLLALAESPGEQVRKLRASFTVVFSEPWVGLLLALLGGYGAGYWMGAAAGAGGGGHLLSAWGWPRPGCRRLGGTERYRVGVLGGMGSAVVGVCILLVLGSACDLCSGVRLLLSSEVML